MRSAQCPNPTWNIFRFSWINNLFRSYAGETQDQLEQAIYYYEEELSHRTEEYVRKALTTTWSAKDASKMSEMGLISTIVLENN